MSQSCNVCKEKTFRENLCNFHYGIYSEFITYHHLTGKTVNKVWLEGDKIRYD